MSEYTPITGELRLMLADINWTEIIDHMQTSSGAVVDGDWLDRWHEHAEHICDNIDSIHANLERENERLREQADKQTVGELFVRVHLDYSDMAQQLEWAAQAVRNIGGDAE